MNGNYIKFYRSFLEWEWWHDPNTCRVFIYILLRANWTDKVWKGVTIKRGSFINFLIFFSKTTYAITAVFESFSHCFIHFRLHIFLKIINSAYIIDRTLIFKSYHFFFKEPMRIFPGSSSSFLIFLNHFSDFFYKSTVI